MQLQAPPRESGRRVRLSRGFAVAHTLEPRTMFAVANASPALPAVTTGSTTADQSIDLGNYFTGAGVATDLYDFNTTLGVIPVELTPTITPLTVANFLTYVNSGAYDDTVINRLVSGFVWQSGGFTYSDDSGFTQTPTNAAVENEYSQPNVEGSIALAKVGSDANSGTDQFFFNLADNSQNLDSQNGGFTVFGHVVGAAGLAVMNAIGRESTINDTADSSGNFTDLPVQNSSAGVAASNLLYINSITAVTSPYTVTSSNTSIATASVSGNTLTFTPLAAGTANLTVTAMDTAGDTVSQTFAVTIPAATVAPSTTLPAVNIAPTAGSQTRDLDSFFSGAQVPANSYDFATTLGDIPVQLTPSVTPLTVANFLSYVGSGAYNNTVIDQLNPGHLWQAGQYTFANGQFVPTATTSPVENEPYQADTLGTIAMQKPVNDPNGATDEFFFNTTDNSQTLSGVDGGYSVFGNVLGSAGLAVMQAIGSEETIDDGASITYLPVQNAADGATASNLLYINSVTPLATAYSVSSDNTSVVTASVSGNQLTFNPLAAGSADLTVTATGVDGSTESQTFAVTVAVPVTPVAIGAGSGVTRAVYHDAGGATATVTLSGNGASATLEFTGTDVVATKKGSTETVTGTAVGLYSVDVLDDSATRVPTDALRVTTVKGAVSIGSIDAGSALRSLLAPQVTLTGDSTIEGVLYTTTLGSLGASATLDASAFGTVAISGAAAGAIVSSGDVGVLTLRTAWAGSLQAQVVDKLITKDASASIDVTEGIETLQVNGTFSGNLLAGYLATAVIGTVSNASITLDDTSEDIKKLTAHKVTGSNIEGAGVLGTITIAEPISDTNILAGVDTATVSPTAVDAAEDASGEILSLHIGGSRTTTGFVDSSIGAKELLNVSLGNITDQASTAAFYGIAAQQIVRLTADLDSKPFSLVGVTDETILKDRLSSQKIVPTNITIEIVSPTTSSD